MTNQAVPSLPPLDPGMYRLLTALRANVLKLNGTAPADKLAPLSTSATTAEIIAAINLIIARLT